MSRYSDDEEGGGFTDTHTDDYDMYEAEDAEEYEEGEDEDVLEEGEAVIDQEEEDEEEEDSNGEDDEREDEDETLVDEEQYAEDPEEEESKTRRVKKKERDSDSEESSEEDSSDLSTSASDSSSEDSSESSEEKEEDLPVVLVKTSKKGAQKVVPMEEKEEKEKVVDDKPKVKKKRVPHLPSDEEVEDKEKAFGQTNFHHYINFFLHNSAGLFATSNQIHTPADVIKQHLHYYYTCAKNVFRMMMELRNMRFRFHVSPLITLDRWKQFIALGSLEKQLEWLLDNHLYFYEKQRDFNIVWREIITLWWTEEQYQAFVQQIQALPSHETELPLPPKECTMVSYTIFNPGTNSFRIWKNRMLQHYLKKRELYAVRNMILVYCKAFNLTDKGKKRGKKDNDPLIKKEYKKDLFRFRTLFAKQKYQCKLYILTSNHLCLYTPDHDAMPDFEKIDPEDLPPSLQKLRGRPVGVLYSNEMMVKLHDWKPGDFIRTESYLHEAHPYVELRMVIAIPNIYTKYTLEELERTRRILEVMKKQEPLLPEQKEQEGVTRILASLEHLPRIPLPASMEFLGLSGLKRHAMSPTAYNDIGHSED